MQMETLAEALAEILTETLGIAKQTDRSRMNDLNHPWRISFCQFEFMN
jgi:hypothetical protein